MKISFADVPVGRYFVCNNTIYRKESTRTGRLIDTPRVFYFRKLEVCILCPPSA